MKFLAFVVLWGVLVTGAPGQPRLPAARPATSVDFLRPCQARLRTVAVPTRRSHQPAGRIR